MEIMERNGQAVVEKTEHLECQVSSGVAGIIKAPFDIFHCDHISNFLKKFVLLNCFFISHDYLKRKREDDVQLPKLLHVKQ